MYKWGALLFGVVFSLVVSAQGTLNIAVLGVVDTLNPFLATTGAERIAVGMLYETLARTVPGGQEPFLAKSWEVVPPQKVVIFHLREGIKWHDGVELTAEDVAFTINYVKEKRLPMWVILAYVDKAEVIDPYTVAVHLTQYSPMVLSVMAPAIPILPKHIWQAIENPLAFPNTEDAVGTGPFRLIEFAAGRYVRLKNTGFYWRGIPKIEELVVHMVTSDTVGMLGFLRGDFDYLYWNISPVLAERIDIAPEQYPHVHLYRSPGTSVVTLLPNVRIPPLDSLEFRRALSLAIDRDDMLTRLLRGFGAIASWGLMTPRNGAWFNPNAGYPSYDPKEATAILEGLGFRDTNGDGIRELPDGAPLSFTLICPSDKTSVEAAALIAFYFSQIGIKLTIEPLSPDAFDLALKQAKFTLALQSIAAFTVVDMYYYYFHSSRGVIRGGQVVGFNRGGFSDPELDAILSQLLMAEGEEKMSLCHRIQVLLAEKLPRIPLYIPDNLEVYRDDKLVGWAPTPEEGVLSEATLFNLKARK
jgi:peptide/nickel transport system substrate-binding protein